MVVVKSTESFSSSAAMSNGAKGIKHRFVNFTKKTTLKALKTACTYHLLDIIHKDFQANSLQFEQGKASNTSFEISRSTIHTLSHVVSVSVVETRPEIFPVEAEALFLVVFTPSDILAVLEAV